MPEFFIRVYGPASGVRRVMEQGIPGCLVFNARGRQWAVDRGRATSVRSILGISWQAAFSVLRSEVGVGSFSQTGICTWPFVRGHPCGGINAPERNRPLIWEAWGHASPNTGLKEHTSRHDISVQCRAVAGGAGRRPPIACSTSPLELPSAWGPPPGHCICAAQRGSLE